jgi:EpsI family protein
VTRRLMIVTCMLLGVAWYLSARSASEPVQARQSFGDFPERIDVWQGGPQNKFSAEILQVLGVDDYVSRIYTGPGASAVGLYIGYYRSQRQGDTIHSPLNCLPGAGWNPVRRDILRIPVDLPSPLNEIGINRIVIQRGMARQVVLYWYQNHGRVIASEYIGKIYAVLDAIRTNRTDGALVRVVSPVIASGEPAVNQAESLGIRFVQGVFPVLRPFLPE